MKTTLGIDLGTTKIAAVIIDEKRQLLAVANMPHRADLPTVSNGAEQCVEKIIDCVAATLAQLAPELLQKVSAVAVTGQMHSVLLGNEYEISPLVTWQDHRCGKAMLKDFKQKANIILREGFGGTTLARLAAVKQLDRWDFASTISDYLVKLLTGSHTIVTDPTHAASWGLYNNVSGKWNRPAVDSLGIPWKLLPAIHPSGVIVGKICPRAAKQFGLPSGIAVVNAIGDNQASIFGSGTDFEHEIYLTLGTGAQLSIVVTAVLGQLSELVEARPFPGGRTLLVTAPLCGGAAFTWLADTINAFRRDLGEPELPTGKLLDQLDVLTLAELEHGKPEITISPHFLGERWNPSLRGCCNGLTLNNTTPGKIGAALALGIIRNLKEGFQPEQLMGRKTIIGSGNAVRLLKSIQWSILKEFALPLRFSETQEEAAVGAALQAVTSI